MPYDPRPCEICGEIIPAPRSATTRFCSIACRAKSPRKRGGPRRDIRERFWEKVNKDGPVMRPELECCWVWTANTARGGYGHFTVEGKERLAHRVAWELTNNAIPPGVDILHRCDNPPCVRPEHLFQGVHMDNMRDSVAKGRMGGEHHPRAKLTESDVAEIRRRYSLGDRLSDIAASYHLATNSLTAIIRGTRWPLVGGAVKEPRSLAKLTTDDVRHIRERYAEGDTAMPLTREYGVTEHTIYQIVVGNTWKKAGGPIQRHPPRLS